MRADAVHGFRNRLRYPRRALASLREYHGAWSFIACDDIPDGEVWFIGPEGEIVGKIVAAAATKEDGADRVEAAYLAVRDINEAAARKEFESA